MFQMVNSHFFPFADLSIEFYSDMLLTSDMFPSMVLEPLREAAGRDALYIDGGRSAVSDSCLRKEETYNVEPPG